MNIIELNIDIIKGLCEKHNVNKLFVFGSILTNKFKKSSDIDLLVHFNPINLYDYADNFFNFKSSLEVVLKRKIDLIEDKAIKNPYLKHSIDSSKLLIYG